MYTYIYDLVCLERFKVLEGELFFKIKYQNEDGSQAKIMSALHCMLKQRKRKKEKNDRKIEREIQGIKLLK